MITHEIAREERRWRLSVTSIAAVELIRDQQMSVLMAPGIRVVVIVVVAIAVVVVVVVHGACAAAV